MTDSWRNKVLNGRFFSPFSGENFQSSSSWRSGRNTRSGIDVNKVIDIKFSAREIKRRLEYEFFSGYVTWYFKHWRRLRNLVRLLFNTFEWKTGIIEWFNNTLKNNTIGCKKLATIVSGRKNVARPFFKRKQVSKSAEMQQQHTYGFRTFFFVFSYE